MLSDFRDSMDRKDLLWLVPDSVEETSIGNSSFSNIAVF